HIKSLDFTRDEEHFYGDGRRLIQNLQRAAERCGVLLDDYKVCLELGCGVGRLTVWLSEVLPKILAADISRLRLDLNQRALRRFQRSNVEHHHIVTIDSLSNLPDFDAFFSIIVLQHNPPPLIIMLLKIILRKLRPDGIAYFQVPTFIKNYTFRLDEYLRGTLESNHMEMHAIPQKLLFGIINDCGCELLEIREDPWTDSREIISNSVFVKKTASR
ncbi:MAG TPA: class I SAM-dependent methyltransferase, partial [Phycisphaerae bacterium]|nr:class I SAM-dependent methyltransferase [Phycisphaerae bacterium]